jgi:hypothetical protein
LLVSGLTGAAAAQSWTFSTTLALVCAFCGFQAEHPIVLQLKQRRSFKPRFLVWGGLYSAVTLAIAFWLYLSSPVLLWLYLGAIAALVVDTISVLQREQKSIFNEIITFAAVCLSAPLAYAATTGTISTAAMGLWALNTLYFSSTIFTVKLRKPKTSSPVPGVVYHAIATLIIATLYYLGWLSLVTALAFGLALLKFGIIVLNQQWYRTSKNSMGGDARNRNCILFSHHCCTLTPASPLNSALAKAVYVNVICQLGYRTVDRSLRDAKKVAPILLKALSIVLVGCSLSVKSETI